MEFFQEIHSPDLDTVYLKNLLTLNNLTNLCTSISSITSQKINGCEIYCTWGSFTVRREEIKYGVRFSLLNCPHALAWTITYNEESEDIIIHCTIDKREQDPDFIDSIHEFVGDWSNGITNILQETHNKSLNLTGANNAPLS